MTRLTTLTQRFKGLNGRANAPAASGEWSDIEAFLSEVTELSKAPASLGEFADATLARTLELLEAIGGAVWLANELGEIECISKAGTDPERKAGTDPERDHSGFEDLLSKADASHREFLTEAAGSGGVQRCRVQGAGGDELLRLAAACRLDDQTTGIVEVLQPATLSEQALAGNEKLLIMVGQLTESFHQRQQQREFYRDQELFRQREVFFRRVHESLDLGPTAYRIVNEGRHLIGCDRVSLAAPDGRGFSVIAISGIETVESKSDVVRSMGALATAVAGASQWLQFRGETDDLPPQIQDRVIEFVDLSHAASVDALPLMANQEQPESEPVGVLILERYSECGDDHFEARASSVATLAASAVRNALEHESLPLLGFSKTLRGFARLSPLHKRRWLGVACATLVVAVMLYVVPIRFTVQCEGEAVARTQRHIFAPLDGEIIELACRHDEPVQNGQVLLRLRNRQLDLELERLIGEHQTVEKKLLAINLARLEQGDDQTRERYPGQLAAEEQELKQRLESISAERRLLKQQRDALIIRSPFAGQMMTWDPEGLLADRPVQRGQRLLTVADLDGEWGVELEIPIRNVGHVVESVHSLDAPLRVEFYVVNGIGSHFEGEVTEIARRIDQTEDQRLAMRAWVSVPRDAIESLRPGAKVRARIDCGKRSAGFVWFHEIINTIKQWVFL